MKRNSVNYKSVLSLFLPKGILDYFEIVEFSDMGSYYIICLDELPAIPEEYSGLLEFGVMGIANGILTIYTPYV